MRWMKYTVNKQNSSFRILDGEAVIISSETSYYYSLNKTGTFIWNLLLEEEQSLEEIVKKVSSHYEQASEAIHDKIAELLEDLVREKLVEQR
jgi:hypothetical protein